jgi:uncharacterized protein
MKRRELLILALATGAFAVMGHTPYRQWYVYRKKRLILVASEADEASMLLGEAIAQTLATHLPESKAMLATTASSLDIVKLLKSEQLDLALHMSDEAYETLQGVGRFRGWAVPLKALAVFGSSVLHLVTLKGNGISGVPDLKGKIVATGIPGSRTEVMVLRVLEAYGIDPERDIRRESLPADQAIRALKEKRVDAFGWVDMVPGGVIRDLAATPALAIKFLDHGEALPKIEAKYGRLYHRGTIPREAYAGLPADIAVAAVAHLLVCRDDFPTGKAYQISKTLAEHRNEGTLAGWKLRGPLGPAGESPLAFHPGALQFYEGRPFPVGDEGTR